MNGREGRDFRWQILVPPFHFFNSTPGLPRSRSIELQQTAIKKTCVWVEVLRHGMLSNVAILSKCLLWMPYLLRAYVILGFRVMLIDYWAVYKERFLVIVIKKYPNKNCGTLHLSQCLFWLHSSYSAIHAGTVSGRITTQTSFMTTRMSWSTELSDFFLCVFTRLTVYWVALHDRRIFHLLSYVCLL